MIVTSITVYNPREVKADQSAAASYDYSSAEWIGDGAGGGKYSNKYKLVKIKGVENIVNIQKPGFATADGIYMGLASSDVKKVTVNGTETSEYDMQGAGMLLHLAAMTEKYNDILIYNSKGEAFAELYGYYADGTDSGTVEPVEKPKAPASLNVSFNEEEGTCTISFDEVEGITTYNFYVGAKKIGTVPENKTFKISDLNVEGGKKYTFGVTSVNAENVESDKATTEATVPVFSALSAPTQIYAHIDALQTNYTVGVEQEVAGAEGYKFYVNGTFVKKIARDQVITIEEMEKHGLKRGEVNKFGISAFNSKGESAITTIDVSVPGKKEETTTPSFEEGKELIPSKMVNAEITLEKHTVGQTEYVQEHKAESIHIESGKWYVGQFTITSSVRKYFEIRVQDAAAGHVSIPANTEFKKVLVEAGQTVNVRVRFKADRTTDSAIFDICMGYIKEESEAGKVQITNNSLRGYTNEPEATKYTVSIDGTEKQYEEGATIAVPADGQGYYNVTKKEAYAPGTELTVNENMTLKSIKLSVTMTKGASIRLAAPTGLRFQTTVTSGNGIAADEILNSPTVTTGTLITTLRFYEANGNTLTRDSKYTFLDIANNGWFNEETGKFCGSIVRIKATNYNRAYIAVGYATINYSNGDSKTVYADVTVNNAKSIQYVAEKVQKSAAYNGYSAKQKDIINKYVNREEIPE